jgi:hypothetical protein
MNFHCLERIRELFLEPNTHKTLSPWRRIRRKSLFGSQEHCSMKNPSHPRKKNPVVWYSHQCTPASHHSRCTLTTNKIAPLVLWKSIRIHFHHFTSSHPPLPRLWRQGEIATRGEQLPIKEANHSRVIFSSHPFLLISIAISRSIFP